MRDAVASLRDEAHLPAGQRLHVDRAHLRVGAEAVGDDRARNERNDRAHAGIVAAQDRRAVERHAVQEVDEGLACSFAKSCP